MLRLARLSSPAQKKQFLDQFDPNTMSWLVSDLRTKFEIQKIFLQSQGYFEDLSVLRASELWRYLLRRVRPEMRFVSSDFLRTTLKEALKSEKMQLSQNADAVVADFIDSFIAVHSHPLGDERMRDWFMQHPESLSRWGSWYLLSKKYVDQFLKEERMAPAWVAGLLQNETQFFGAFWQRPLLVDLGSQLSRTEAELILEIAKFCDVTVLIPETTWTSEYIYLLEGYRLLSGQAHEKLAVEKIHHANGEQKAFSFSGLLAESKSAVRQVHAWLKAGVASEAIAVIAPDVEVYWPTLAPLFAEEGIPVAKDQSFRLQTLPQVSQWLSRLRLSSRQVSFADLENAVYLQEPFLRYEEFHSLFSELLGEEDLIRHDRIKKSFDERILPTEAIGRDEFLGFAIRAWRDVENLTALEICLREFLTNADDSLAMNLSSWIYFLEQVIAKKEVRWKTASLNGVHVTNLSSADSVVLSHRIFLGLCESQLKEKKNLLLDPSDVNSLSTEIGFFIEHPEISALEFDLRWLSENKTKESHYYYPQTGVSGSAEAASSFWMSVRDQEDKQSGEEHIELRWDQRQRASLKWLSEETGFHEAMLLETETRIDQDLGLEELPAVKLAKAPSLSPTSFERYRQCPFVFAAEKLFRLLDLPLVDLDLDRRKRGALAHGLLERLSEEPRRFDWKDGEVEIILDQLRIDLKLQVYDEFSWQSIKEKHFKLAQRFLSFEKDWRQRFPKTKTEAREKAFEFYIDSSTGKWTRDSEEFIQHVVVKGKIDRIDTDSDGRVAVLDYKLSGGQLKSASKWMEENQLQLALYTLALEQGFVEDFSEVEVISAVYMVLKNMNRDYGFKVTEAAGPLFDLDKKQNRVSGEEKQKLLTEIGKLIFELTQKIITGKIAPEPLDKKDCVTCVWRQQCRAPHLNL